MPKYYRSRAGFLGTPGALCCARPRACLAQSAHHVKLTRMEWTDEGIVLGVRRHGESSAIVELLTREHGRHLGLVRGGAGSRMRPLLQPGNSVTAVWRARLDEDLGKYFLQGNPFGPAPTPGSPLPVSW